MEERVNSASKINLVYVSGGVTIVFLLFFLSLFYFNASQALISTGIVLLLIAGAVTFIFYRNQCPNCKNVFSLKKVSNELIKQWEEPKQYNGKTIYYYSDGATEKDVKNGPTQTFVARYEKHKDGFQCKKCNETSYKTKDIFVNRDDWLRVTTPNRITTSINKPKQHYTNLGDFSSDLFEPTYYQDRSGKRKSIPASVKKNLWIRYNGKKYKGPCFVCREIIDIHNFEAGHEIAVSNNGSDNMSNLRPICKSCNRSMGNMKLSEFKRKYHN